MENKELTDSELLAWAIEEAGSQAELGRRYTISQAVISTWKKKQAIPQGWRMYFTAQMMKVKK